MPLINVLFVLVVFLVALYLINAKIPMADPIKLTLNIVLIIVLVFWLLRVLGFGNILVG
jgi:hypothetical protein